MSTTRNDSNTSQQKGIAPFEQLWYTWSKIGLDTISVGNRIRAATDKLSDVRDPFVQSLEQHYLYYVLPKGTDSISITPDQAPICLSLTQINGRDRILVNKLYTGRDGFGRPGAYFIHLVAGMPPDFSAKKAILLWRSPFWKDSDFSIGDSKHLDTVPPGDLLQAGCSGRYRGKYEGPQFKLCPGNPPVHTGQPDFASIQEQLRFIIQAYLTRKPGQQLYIAASADIVADLLFGLTRCLPSPLLRNLTFSTYEQDLQGKDEFLIVGTCWDSSEVSRQDLPDVCYQRHLALNCYTRRGSQLVADPAVARFAHHATQRLLTGDFTLLDTLLAETEDLQDLNVDTFLQYYHNIVEQAQQPTKESIKFCLEQPRQAAKQFTYPFVQAFIIEQALADPTWAKTVVIPGLKSLFSVRDRYPGLADALFRLAQYTSQQAAEAANQGNAARFDNLLDIVVCIADSRSEVWRMQPRIFAQQPNMQSFLTMHPQEHFRLLTLWAHVQPPIDNASIRPFLHIAEQHFVEFYQLEVPANSVHASKVLADWKDLATEELISSLLLVPGGVERLGQHYGQPIETLIWHRVNTSWSDVENLYVTLVQNRYPPKLRSQLRSILLNSPNSAGKLTPLLRRAPLEPSEWEEFLTEYGPKYLPQPQEEPTILDLFDKLATYSQPSKITVLNSWLKSSDNRAQLHALAAWFDAPENMDKVLTRAQLTSDESERFLEVYGAYYLEHYISRYKSPSSHVIVEYVRKYLQDFKPRNLGEKTFFSFLSNNGILPYFHHDIQTEVGKWFDLQRFLQKPSLTEKKLQDFGSIVYSKPLEIRSALVSELVGPLASAFASHVENETHLSALVFALKGIFPTRLPLLQMLYEMAEIVRDDVANPDPREQQRAKALLKIYIRFALCFDSVYTFPPDAQGEQESEREYKWFVRTFLDILLQSTNEKDFQQLDIGATVPVLLQRWQEYKSSCYSSAPESRYNTWDGQGSPSRPSPVLPAAYVSAQQPHQGYYQNETSPALPPANKPRQPYQSPQQPNQPQQENFMQPAQPQPEPGIMRRLKKGLGSLPPVRWIIKLIDRVVYVEPRPNTSMKDRKAETSRKKAERKQRKVEKKQQKKKKKK